MKSICSLQFDHLWQDRIWCQGSQTQMRTENRQEVYREKVLWSLCNLHHSSTWGCLEEMKANFARTSNFAREVETPKSYMSYPRIKQWQLFPPKLKHSVCQTTHNYGPMLLSWRTEADRLAIFNGAGVTPFCHGHVGTAELYSKMLARTSLSQLAPTHSPPLHPILLPVNSFSLSSQLNVSSLRVILLGLPFLQTFSESPLQLISHSYSLYCTFTVINTICFYISC